MWKIVFLCVLHVALVASKSILLEKMTEINGAETRSNSSDQFIEQSNEDDLVRSQNKSLESIQVPQEIDQSSTLNNSSDEVSSNITTPKPIEPLRTEKPKAFMTISSWSKLYPIPPSSPFSPYVADDDEPLYTPQSALISDRELENSRSEDEYEQGLENLDYEQEMDKLEYLQARESAQLNYSSTVAMEGLAYERKELELRYALAKKELNYAQAKNRLKHQQTQEKFYRSYSARSYYSYYNQIMNSPSYNGNGFF